MQVQDAVPTSVWWFAEKYWNQAKQTKWRLLVTNLRGFDIFAGIDAWNWNRTGCPRVWICLGLRLSPGGGIWGRCRTGRWNFHPSPNNGSGIIQIGSFCLIPTVPDSNCVGRRSVSTLPNWHHAKKQSNPHYRKTRHISEVHLPLANATLMSIMSQLPILTCTTQSRLSRRNCTSVYCFKKNTSTRIPDGY